MKTRSPSWTTRRRPRTGRAPTTSGSSSRSSAMPTASARAGRHLRRAAGRRRVRGPEPGHRDRADHRLRAEHARSSARPSTSAAVRRPRATTSPTPRARRSSRRSCRRRSRQTTTTSRRRRTGYVTLRGRPAARRPPRAPQSSRGQTFQTVLAHVQAVHDLRRREEPRRHALHGQRDRDDRLVTRGTQSFAFTAGRSTVTTLAGEPVVPNLSVHGAHPRVERARIRRRRRRSCRTRIRPI